MRSFVHTKCVCLRKQKQNMQVQWKSERVPDKTAICFIIIIIIIAKILLQLCGCTCTCLSRILLVIRFLGRRPIFHASIFYYKDSKTLIRLRRCTCMHVLIQHFAGQMFLWHHFIFRLSFVCLFLQKVLTRLYFTYVYLCKDPAQTVWMLIILSCQTSLIPHSNSDNK